MAGDWIKMRGNLWDDPRVAKLCDMTDQGEAAIVGALYWLWAAADQHTEDGCMPGLTLRQIDRKTGVAGFGAALVSIGWLVDDPQGVVIVGFEEHNGTSAKRRCIDAQRKANVRNVSASDADKPKTDKGQKAPTLGAREREEKEKRREGDTISGKVVGAAGAALAMEPKAHPLPEGWQLPRQWGEWAMAEFPHWTPEVVRLEASQFVDHWRGKSGKEARKADWLATWRKWCRSDICQRAHPLRVSGASARHQRMTDDELAAWSAAEGEKARRLLFGEAAPADVVGIQPEGISHEAV
jgi:hypothetical protein